MIDKWDLDPQSLEGIIARPYYIPLPPNWRLHKHYNTEILEQSIEDFVGSSIFTAPYGVFSEILQRKG